MNITIKAEPFSWNEPMAQLALEDFDAIREELPYCAAQSIGTALAKLELLEKQGARVGDCGKMPRSVKEAIMQYGRRNGYDGVCTDECGCTWDSFPACGDICRGLFGYRCSRSDCRYECVSSDGACPEPCDDFWEVSE